MAHVRNNHSRGTGEPGETKEQSRTVKDGSASGTKDRPVDQQWKDENRVSQGDLPYVEGDETLAENIKKETGELKRR